MSAEASGCVRQSDERIRVGNSDEVSDRQSTTSYLSVMYHDSTTRCPGPDANTVMPLPNRKYLFW